MRTFTKWMLVIAGILMLVTGVYAICNPAATLLSLAWVIGFIMLAVGVVETLTYFSWSGMLGSGWMLFDGIVSILVAVIFPEQRHHCRRRAPVCVWDVDSVLRYSQADLSFDCKKLGLKRWWGLTVFGALCMAVGLLTLLRPTVGMFAISVFIGIAFILYGVSLLYIWWIGEIADAMRRFRGGRRRRPGGRFAARRR